MQKKNKDVKGIPLSELNIDEGIVTTEDNVLKFFRNHPKEAFSIQLLREAGFSSNIRKIIQKLIEKEKIIQYSHKQEGKSKWEYVYYLKPSQSVFNLKKTKEGWEIVKIIIDGYWFKVECSYDTDPETELFNGIVIITLGFPNDGDGIIYYEESEAVMDRSWQSSIRFSEVQTNFENLKNRFHIFQGYEHLWDFDVISLGKRSRISKITSIIESDKIILWAGDIGFLFIVNSENHTVSIYPRYRTVDSEGNVTENEEEFDYFDINYGYDYEEKDYRGETFDFVAFGNIEENYDNEILKKDVDFIVLRGRR